MKFIVKVTADHIKRGRKGVRASCPIAHALRDAGFDRVMVDGASFEHGRSGRGRSKKVVKLPFECAKFIRSFDISGSAAVKPFKFEIAA